MQQGARDIRWGLLCWLFVLSLLAGTIQTQTIALQAHVAHSNISYPRFLLSSLLAPQTITRGGVSSSIALTFDDGPDPTYTPLVLNVLAHYGVHATFFCVGEQVQTYPDLALQENQQGNAVENHSWSHVNLTVLPPDIIRKQIQSTSTEIEQATGITPKLFRPPYGSTNENVNIIAREFGLTQILWSIDTQDWQQLGVDQIVKTVLTKVKGGDIILMHDGGGNRVETVQALALIISELQQRGFTFSVL